MGSVAHELLRRIQIRQRQSHAVLAHAVVLAVGGAGAGVVDQVAFVLVEGDGGAVTVVPAAAAGNERGQRGLGRVVADLLCEDVAVGGCDGPCPLQRARMAVPADVVFG